MFFLATLNQRELGLGLFAFINIMLDSHSEKAMRAFESGVMALPNVVACHNVSGKYDYLLQVVVRDMEAFHQLAMHRIRTLGNINDDVHGFLLEGDQALDEPPAMRSRNLGPKYREKESSNRSRQSFSSSH
ncbi:Lrp/AsnC family transcriptional regulator [Paraburkholderia nodosa]|uniref:Lrp/AsnC family transcriptional regulator n=1 Tax=Paraburkholderia nodosa TaxID=392320 RepID=UPI0004BBBBF4|nr:Lrp/AsnC ligand binding domain-containing protein [Paraburkholderia nodosa]